MKFLMVLAPLLGIGLSYLMYKRDGDGTKFFLSLLILGAVVSLGVVGNIMRSTAVLFLMHLVAVLSAYMATLYYMVRGRFVWYIVMLPIVTMMIYLLSVWIGNEHLPSVF